MTLTGSRSAIVIGKFSGILVTRVISLDSIKFIKKQFNGLDFPFVYLGLPIGGDPWKLDFWKPLVNSVISRLSS